MYEELIEGIFENEEDEELFQDAINNGDFFLPIGQVSNPKEKYSYFTRYTLKIDDDFEENIERIHEQESHVGIYIGTEYENPSLICANLNSGDRVTLHHEVKELFVMKDFFIENDIQMSIFVPKNHSNYDIWSSDDYVTIVNEERAYLPDMDVALNDNMTISCGIIDVSSFVDSETYTLDEESLRSIASNSIFFLTDIINNASYPTDVIENAMMENSPLMLSIAGINEIYEHIEKRQTFITILKNIISIISEESEKSAAYVRDEYKQNVSLITAIPFRYNILPEIKNYITMGIDIHTDSTMLKRKIHNIVKTEFNGTVLMLYDEKYLENPLEIKSSKIERKTTFETLVEDKIEKSFIDTTDAIENDFETHDEVEYGNEDIDSFDENEMQGELKIDIQNEFKQNDACQSMNKLEPVIKIMKYDIGCGFISLKEDNSHDIHRYNFEIDYHDREVPCPVIKNITGIMLTSNVHGIPLMNAVGNLICDCDSKYKCIEILSLVINNGEI